MKLFSIYLFALLFFSLAFAGTSSAATGPRKLPFHGKLQSVDASAQTITLSGKSARVFHLTPTTKITDGRGNPSTLSAATVGEDVGGSYTKDADATMTLFSVRFGAKDGSKAGAEKSENTEPAPTPVKTAAPAAAAPASAPTASTAAAPASPTEPEPAAAKGRKQRLTGKVVSVDASANTIVIHGKADQTFTANSTTKVTDASGQPATLASATAGEKVTGSYSKSADGTTLTLSSLKLGK